MVVVRLVSDCAKMRKIAVNHIGQLFKSPSKEQLRLAVEQLVKAIENDVLQSLPTHSKKNRKKTKTFDSMVKNRS